MNKDFSNRQVIKNELSLLNKPQVNDVTRSTNVNHEDLESHNSVHPETTEDSKVLWEGDCIEPSIEPHSTSNPEDELTTYSNAFSSGESELEDLLYHFNNFFASRLDQEMSQFQANLSGILFEQQNHVRRIVSAVTDECTQRYPDSTSFQTSNVMTTERIGTDQEPMMTNENVPKLPYSVSDEGDLLKKQRLLQLLAMSCSISSVLAKQQFRK